MPESLADQSSVLTALAYRLRAIQVDFADEDPAMREQYLIAEMKRSLEKVLPPDRLAFIEGLREKFPTFDPREAALPVPQAAPPPPEPQDPASLARKLVASLRNASDSQRRDAAKVLGELAPTTSSGGLPEPIVQKLKSLLGVANAESIDFARLTELVPGLIEFAVVTDPLVWRTWSAIDPDAAPRTRNLRNSIKAFVVTNKDQAALTDIEELRKMAAKLLGSIRNIGSTLYHNHQKSLSPNQIQEAVQLMGKKMWESWETKYWEKYLELSTKLEEAAVERAVLDSVKAFVRALNQ